MIQTKFFFFSFILSSLLMGNSRNQIFSAVHLQESNDLALSGKETSLMIDNHLVNYISNQVKADSSYLVLIFADSITFKEEVTFNDVDVFFIANYFSTDDYEISVLSSESDNSQLALNTEKGHYVQVIARDIGKVFFNMPGRKGLDGQSGKDGRNGNRMIPSKIAGEGTPGTDGEDGEKGGNGGILEISTLDNNYESNLVAPRGEGGKRGAGGKGGNTFIRRPTPKSIGKDPDIQKFNITTTQESNGKRGVDGKPGKPGKLKKIELIEEKFKKKVSQYFVDDLGIIQKTGWQIHFIKN